MRIGIDAACWSNRRGYGRFTRSLLGELFKTNTAHQYVLFVDAQTHAQSNLPANVAQVIVPTGQAPTAAAAANGRRTTRDLVAMSAAVRHHELDVFFFPSVYTYFPVLTNATIILGVHDIIAEDFPELVFPNRRNRQAWALKGWLARRQADYVMTVSEHAKDGIMRRFGLPSQRIWVIDEAPDPVFRPISPGALDATLLCRHGIMPGDRFFLYLGGINPHKNLATLIGSLAEVRDDPASRDVRLIIIGDIQNDVFTPGLSELRERISALNMTESVHFTGFLPDEEVVHFLSAARAIVLPSLAEGFGLPAIEGAACGTPVIATRNSPLPNLLAGGGLFIDPTRQDELTQAIRQMLGDADARQRMGHVALGLAQKLNWQRSVRQMATMLDAVGQDRR